MYRCVSHFTCMNESRRTGNMQLRRSATRPLGRAGMCDVRIVNMLHCNTLQHTATHCNALQNTAPYCTTLQHPHCEVRYVGCLSCEDLTLQHTATYCNTLQHTATLHNTLHRTARHCNTLQRTATHCNILQHTLSTAAHCNTRKN